MADTESLRDMENSTTEDTFTEENLEMTIQQRNCTKNV